MQAKVDPSADLAMAEHLRSIRDLGESYWWHDHRYQAVASKLPETKGQLLDFGCGDGGFLRWLAARHSSLELFGYDESPATVELLGNKGQGAVAALLPAWPPQKQFDVVTTLDVLEHVDDDVAVLNSLRSCLTKDGRLILTVPAFMLFWSRWDHLLGHRRRYTTASLREALDKAGFELLWSSYLFSYLCVPALWRRAIGNRKQEPGDAAEFPQVGPLVNKALRTLGALERAWFKGLSVPFGTSLMAVAKAKTR